MLAIRGRGIGALGKMSAVHCHDARFSVCCIHLEKKSTISPNSARLQLRNRSTLRAFRQRPVFPEYARSRLFSQKHSFPLKVEKKEINKNADAADINGGHRHSLIELFRDLHRDKSVSPRSTINAESKVSETKTPVKKSSSKAKSPQNKNVGKGTRKTINAEELDKNNETPIATENADAADVNGGHRHSLIELFRDIHRDKPVSPPNAESKVSETKTPAKKSSSKDKLSQKKNVGKTTRKSSNTKELDKSNEASSETPKTLEDTGKAVLSSNAKATKQRKPEASKVMEEASSARKTGGMASEDAMTRKTKLNPLYPPSGKSVMVVESATKAKTIQSYLGGMFEVLPSYGHVRDLAGRSGSVRPNDDFSMVWEVPSSAWTHLKTIKVALNGAENLILATDPDREGEAIAWHLAQMLEQQEALNKEITVARVVFHEITDASIKKALQSPRDLDADLINAYLARRALDYLIGFSVSPLLWRKLPGCQSAGRVQSAALSLICDRELEVDHFKAEEYWTVVAQFCKTGLGLPSGNVSVISELTHLDTKRLNQLSICSQEDAESIKKKILSSNFTVKSSKKSKIHRNPPMPYITSTLQQDSANKLHFTASYTMKLAQKLYEGVNLSDGQATGLITYMRTDGLHVSEDAAKDIQSFVIERYGPDFASKAIRKYFKKVKNAQEAHEAIRPTSIRRLPSTLADFLEPDSLKLYTLIWIRTVACQMEAAAHDLVQVDISNDDGSIIFRASNSKIGFLGYQALYKEKEAGILRENDSGDSSEEAFEVLSALKINDDIEFKVVDLDQHFTKPPARYSEGSLVKKLEELGIGRPSTYAPILKVLQDRNYVTMKNRVLHPEFRGRMVSAFLSHYFAEVSDYSFTADLENELDNVSAGMTEWKGLLKDYWSRFKKYCDLANNVNIRQLEKMLENKFKHILFESLPHRICPSCSEGTLVLKISKYGTGFFIGCNEHPKCKYIVGSVFSEDEDEVTIDKPDLCFQPKLLGQSPTTNENIYLKKGPYGYYVQLGEDRKECSPKRASVSEVKDLDSITLEVALEFLRYPITLGNHPDDDYPVILCHSKAGFSIRHKRTIAPVPKRKDVKNLTLQAAVKLLSSKRAKHTGRPVRGEATTVAT